MRAESGRCAAWLGLGLGLGRGLELGRGRGRGLEMTSSTAATTRPAARRAAAWVPGLTTVSASRLTRGVRKPPTRPKAPSSRARWAAVCTRSSCSGVTSTSGSRMLSWAARCRTGGVARQRVCVCYGEGACVTMGRWHLPRELGRPLCSHRLEQAREPLGSLGVEPTRLVPQAHLGGEEGHGIGRAAGRLRKHQRMNFCQEGVLRRGGMCGRLG